MASHIARVLEKRAQDNKKYPIQLFDNGLITQIFLTSA
jgi:hypothetical protein